MSEATIYNWLKQDRIDRGEAEGATTEPAARAGGRAGGGSGSWRPSWRSRARSTRCSWPRGWPQKALPGDRVSDRAGNQRAAGLHRARGLAVGLLRLEGPPGRAAGRCGGSGWPARSPTSTRSPAAPTARCASRPSCATAAGSSSATTPSGDIMRRARPQGAADASAAARREGSARSRSLDLVGREFRRDRPNELWVTDITEHPTREGKVYCCVVLDTLQPARRRLVDRQHPDHQPRAQRARAWPPSAARTATGS